MRRLCLLALLSLAVPVALPAADPCQPVPERLRTVGNAPAGWQLTGWAFPLRAQDPPKKDEPPKLPRGLKPTPPARIIKHAQNRPFVPPAAADLPASVAYVPSKLSYWLNNQYGDCVSAEEAFNQDCTGVFIQDATVKTWAGRYGWLNGAMLDEVMDQMQKDGMHQDGKVYGVGAWKSVNFADEPTLQAALAVAPLKIGIDADALPSGAGNKSGWYSYGGRPGQYRNEDHCTALCGYGPVAKMFAAVGVNSVPADWPAGSKTAYLHFTWNTIGVVDHDWIMSTCAEAYLRNPSTTTNGAPRPNPGPGPNPDPPVPPTPPVPPVPPGPNPTPPAPGKYTGTVTITQTFVDGVKTGETLSLGSGADVGVDLAKAGVDPAIVLDVLKLLTDLRAKAAKDVILADVLRIISDLK